MDQPKKKLIHKLRFKYRLVLINDESFEEKISFKLTPMNVFVGFSSSLVLYAILIIMLIFFTPLREYVPGYTDTKTKRNLQQLLYKTDSLEEVLKAKELYYQNIVNIINGGEGIKDSSERKLKSSSMGPMDHKYEKEAAFNKNFETEQKNQTAKDWLNTSTAMNQSRTGLALINPTNGLITRGYDENEAHYAIDIVAKPNELVKAVQQGTIIFSEWTPQAGNTVAIQHKNNLVSIYKHNSSILKKVGTFVETGEVIAVVGNTGELSNGPHLHFEIWENGNAVNPNDLLNYN